MKLPLLFSVFVVCTVLRVSATFCQVGNSSSCQRLLTSSDSDACYSCDGGTSVEAGSCDRGLHSLTPQCSELQMKCEANGGQFLWCYGDSCNSCKPRYLPLPLDTWAKKSVAFVTAHPDDLEALAGATVTALTKQVGSIAHALCRQSRICHTSLPREPQSTSSSSPTATRAAAPPSAKISHPMKSQQPGAWRQLQLPPLSAYRSPMSAAMDVEASFVFHSLCRCTCSAMKTEAWLAPTTTTYVPHSLQRPPLQIVHYRFSATWCRSCVWREQTSSFHFSR